MKNIRYINILLTLIQAFQVNAKEKLIKAEMVSCLDSEIYCESQGSGQTIILAHAGYLDTRMWDDQFDFLASKGFQVIRFDHFGHGKTRDGKNSPFHWEVFEAIMNHYQLKQATIIGCSMGSRAAIEFATTAFEKMLWRFIPKH